jgi:hypothetical protein
MKKVLLVCNGSYFSEGAFKMATYLQTRQPMLLTGVFLGAKVFRYVYLDADYVAAEVAGELEDEQEAIARSREQFTTLCEKNDIEYRLHEDISFHTLEDLKKEMRFADLAIIGSEMFYTNYDDQQPNTYLAEALRHAECPVLLVPEKFDATSGNILAYDGSEASVYAIKQFASLLPELCDNETLLVYASSDNKDVPDLSYIEELVTRHFTNLSIYKLDIDSKEYFTTWLSDRKNSILITGSYGRSEISNLFRCSFITKAIEAHHVPIFIAHL